MNLPTGNAVKCAVRIAAMLLLAAGATYAVSAGWRAEGTPRLLLYVLISIIASRMRVNLPGSGGVMSLNFVFVLIAIVGLNAVQAALVAIAGALAGCYWELPRSTAARFVIEGLNSGAAAWAAQWLYRWQWERSASSAPLLALVGASLAYFLLSAAGAACYFALAEKRPILALWRDGYAWRLPVYIVGGALACAIGTEDRRGLWHGMLLLLPALLVVHRAYVVYLRRLATQKIAVEGLAALHMRTIENLALAIEARDARAYDRLRRVRAYALAVGASMRLPEPELEALRAAALLHDIGELAVPEHILRKREPWTPEETERMKLHPVVGAEILSQVEFPYPVAQIVRSHHERWDGRGYPDGLRGEAIPMGARILAAVDRFDELTLANGRDAARKLQQLAGMELDPCVVSAVVALRPELARLAPAPSAPAGALNDGVPSTAPASGQRGFVSSIAGAREEAQLLAELTQDFGSATQLTDLLSALALRLKRLLGYDAIVIAMRRDDRLIPEYVEGDSFRLLTSIEMPLGSGLSGQAAQTGLPILNGDVWAEFVKADGGWESQLQSATCLPLFGAKGTLGVMTLYRVGRDAFTSEDLRVLQSAAARISPLIDRLIQSRAAESNATIDPLTNLPNARSLFLRLDSELARARRSGETLAVLSADLDNFNAINERFGHAAGDRALRLVADALRDGCREYDFVARMDHNKFVMIFPVSDAADIARRTQDFREIGQKTGSDSPAIHGLTMSLGQACFPEDGADAERLLAEADCRMYRNKRESRRSAKRPVSLASRGLALMPEPKAVSESPRTWIC